MSVHRLRRWPNIEPIMAECLVLDATWIKRKILKVLYILGLIKQLSLMFGKKPTLGQGWLNVRDEYLHK